MLFELTNPFPSPQSYLNEELPPVIKATAEPSFPGRQVSGTVLIAVNSNLSGSPTNAVSVAKQPAASVTVNLYCPANKPEIFAPAPAGTLALQL